MLAASKMVSCIVRRTSVAHGWDMLCNGELQDTAEAAGFDAFVTTGRNMPYQQNVRARRMAIVVLLPADSG